VVCKVEPRDAEHPVLRFEAQVYRRLRGCAGVPRYLGFLETARESILVLARLGHSLEWFRKQFPGGAIPRGRAMAEVLASSLALVRELHRNGYLHRDLKPENFLFARNDRFPLFIIDFGLSKRYMQRREDGEVGHIEFATGRPFLGTPRYASMHAHLGHQLSRRDDLESWLYVMLFLHRGSLPWSGVTSSSCAGVRYKGIYRLKREVFQRPREHGIDECWVRAVELVRGTRFADEPPYAAVLELLEDGMR
jgi:serine/threonine protein kinase